MLAQVTHILPITTIRRERLLPVPGRLVVRKGQKVAATDVVAEAKLAPEHMLLNIARSLGVPQKDADKALQVREGARIAEGDVLAGPVGMTKRVVRSPRNGKVILAGEGQVLLETDSPPFELRAGVPGVISDLIGERGVVVETTGALIQGIWGNSRIDFGLMYILTRQPDDILTPDQLDVSMRGSVIMAGHCGSMEVLKTAADLPLRGLILGSLDASLVPVAMRLRFPIIVLEGFGQQPMNSTAYKLLTTNERREVALNAENWDRYRGSRPEVVIALPASADPGLPRETEVFSANQHVRIIRAPYAGKIGTITSVRSGSSVFPSGIAAAAADIRLENGDTALVPLANLEVLV